MTTLQNLTSQDQDELRARWIKMNREHEQQRAQLLAQGIPEYDLAHYLTPCDWGQFSALICGAKGKRTGKPCPSRAIYSNGRCRFHGGLSTGPTTPEGRAKAGLNGRGKLRTP